HAAAGNKVYPFHLGDINLATPHNIIEATIKAIEGGKTGYNPNYGIRELREVLAEDINRSHGTDYTYENVVIQPGGKPTIGKYIMALMNFGDGVLYPNPGYPIYESMIEFHNGFALPYGYEEGEKNFVLDLEGLERSITPKTRLLIYNNQQNPTAAESSEEELEQIAEIVRKYDLYVLTDEAYFDMRYEGKSKSLVQLPGMKERCVILYTFSKKFAMTGWRLGATIGPTEIMQSIAKLNVNDESCPNHFVQYGAIEGLTGDQTGVENILKTLKERRDKAVEILNSIEGVHCFKPESTFYLFPRVTEAMKNKNLLDYNKFRVECLKNTGVSFCTRMHFGRRLPKEKNYYVRFAYSGIDVDQIEEGLTGLKKYLES
ncbi:MAG: aminotransferase class I/II-fold pyridoxal phosphate-dependent enzyme, partial [Spirochaetes bacterium]|nr:aminotransferase class I/II-fold pyridoxal phosphate-dependent enzyme [Spirochaetota bacterium]